MGYQQDIFKAAKCTLPWKKLSGKSLLITGATGLIGGAIVDVLMNRPTIDFNVYALGRNKDRFKSLFDKYSNIDNLHFLEQDVTKPMQGDMTFHYIIHAASGANPMEYATNPVGVMKTNILGTINLMDYGLQHHLEKFLLVSSGEVYGEGNGNVFTENYSGYVDCNSVRACYPSSKRAAETLCASYASQYGVDINIVRPSHIYGPYFTESDNRVYAQFIRNVLRGEDIVMKSTGEQFRSWCYVVDCVSAILYIVLKGKSGEAYNVADNNSNINIKSLAEMIAEIGGRKVLIEQPSAIEKKGFNIVSNSVFDTKKLESLGWKTEGRMYEKLKSTIKELKK